MAAVNVVTEPETFQQVAFQKMATSSTQYSALGGATHGADVGDDGINAATRPPLHRRAHAGAWLATEKIHGAQMQLYCRPGQLAAAAPPARPPPMIVRAAKRNGFLDDVADNFFGFQELVDELRPALSTLYGNVRDAVREDDADGAQTPPFYMVVYGEIFGGWYPADPQSWRGATLSGRVDARGKLRADAAAGRPVQEGVYYAPGKHFAVFDIALVACDGHELLGFLPFAEVLRLSALSGVFTPPLIVQGEWGAVDAASALFQSRVPEQLSAFHAAAAQGGRAVLTVPTTTTPASKAKAKHAKKTAPQQTPQVKLYAAPLPDGTNWAEGVVLRPDSAVMSVAYKGAAARPLEKRKHPLFSEIELIDTDGPPDEAAGLFLNRVLKSFVTENRVAAVASKTVGGRAGVSADVVADDVWEDFWSCAPEVAHIAYAKAAPEELAAVEIALRQRIDAALL
jgi:hypothetical protein